MVQWARRANPALEAAIGAAGRTSCARAPWHSRSRPTSRLPLTVLVIFFVQPSDRAWDPLRSPLYLFCTALRRGLGPLKLSRSFGGRASSTPSSVKPDGAF